MKTREEQQELTNNAKKASKFFKIELTISIFDNVIFKWIFPPQKD